MPGPADPVATEGMCGSQQLSLDDELLLMGLQAPTGKCLPILVSPQSQEWGAQCCWNMGAPLLSPGHRPTLLQDRATPHNGERLVMLLRMWNCVLQDQAAPFIRYLCICLIWGCKANPPQGLCFLMRLAEEQNTVFSRTGLQHSEPRKNDEKEKY